MATQLKNLSSTSLKPNKVFKKIGVGIAVASWNPEITNALKEGAVEFLLNMGVSHKNIFIAEVPGSYELPQTALWLAAQKNIDAVITIGCVIQGETRHFDFICDACANGVMQVGLNTGKPCVFGVLTTNNQTQAKERAGGKYGNKGIEAAETALKMFLLKQQLLD
jgi:6,7-dimethyl-8-ribityllumazine synthase